MELANNDRYILRYDMCRARIFQNEWNFQLVLRTLEAVPLYYRIEASDHVMSKTRARFGTRRVTYVGPPLTAV
jgi:hypothetical protein